MKKIVLLVVAIGLGLGGFAQNFVEEFEKRYADEENFTTVNISAKMFKLIAAVAEVSAEQKGQLKVEIDGEEADLFQTISKLTGMKVLSAKKDGEKYYEAAVAALSKNRSAYEELMSVKEGKEWVRGYVREENGRIPELVMVIWKPKEFTLIGFTGDIDLKEISKVAKMVNVKGAEQLEKIDTTRLNK